MAQQATAAVLIIGNEILSGRTKDANLSYLGEQLAAMGVRLKEARVVEDVEEDIIAALNHMRQAYDYVFTTGGIGPTHDDITSATVAKAFGRKHVLDAKAREILETYYGTTDINEARLRMAHVPEGAELVPNPVSGAPGFRVENVYVFAGVPSIMRAMFDAIRHQLKGGAPIQSRSVTAQVLEGDIAKELTEIQNRYPTVSIGSYPIVRNGRIGTTLVMRGDEAEKLNACLAEVRALLVKAGAESIEEIS